MTIKNQFLEYNRLLDMQRAAANSMEGNVNRYLVSSYYILTVCGHDRHGSLHAEYLLLQFASRLVFFFTIIITIIVVITIIILFLVFFCVE